MPKLKTNKGAVKRFRKTASGYKFKRANRNHILTKVSQKCKRHARANRLVNESDTLSVARMLNDK